jgi:hypothetical protein
VESATYRCVKGYTDGTYKTIRGVGEDLLPPQHQLKIIRQVGEEVGDSLINRHVHASLRTNNKHLARAARAHVLQNIESSLGILVE